MMHVLSKPIAKAVLTILLFVSHFYSHYAAAQSDCSALAGATASATPADCPSNGKIQVSTSAGTSNTGYLYQIVSGPAAGGFPTNTVSSSLFESLPAGTYTVRVTCGTQTHDVTATVADAYMPLSLTVSTGAVTCSSGTASAVVTASGSGGKGALQYAILKSDNANTPDNQFTYGVSSSFNVTGLGTYQVRVKDECNNYITYSTSVTATSPVATAKYRWVSTETCGLTRVKFDLVPVSGGSAIEPTNSGYRIQFYDISTSGCPASSDGLTLLSDKVVNNWDDLFLDGSPLTATRVLIKTTSPCGEQNLTCVDLPNTTMQFYPKINIPCESPVNHVDIGISAWNFAYPAHIVIRANDASGTILLDATINNSDERATVAQNLPVHSAYWFELTDACGQSAVRTESLPTTSSGGHFGWSSDLNCVSMPDRYRVYVYMYGYIPGVNSSATIELVDLSGNVVATGVDYNVANNDIAFNDVPLGTYKIRVTSQGGDCVTELNGQLELTGSRDTAFRFFLTAQKYPLCGGNADVKVMLDYNGSAPISFSITGPGGQTISNTTGLFANMAPGTYIVAATADMSSCGKPDIERSVQVTVTADDSFPKVVKVLGVICETAGVPATTGKAIFQFSGFGPFIVESTKRTVPQATAPDATYQNVAANWTLDNLEPNATYDIRIIDQCGKTAVTQVTIKPLEVITLSNNAQPCIDSSYTFGVEDMLNATYAWSHDGTDLGVSTRQITIDPYIPASHDGNYTCTVSLADGCIIREVELTLTGANCSLPLSGLGDYVWNDINMDGIQDAAEVGVAGITVTLYGADGTSVLASTTTDASGYYSFEDLYAGSYVVGFSNLPSNYIFSPSNGALNDATNSDAVGQSGKTVVIALADNEFNRNIDAGIFNSMPVTLIDFQAKALDHGTSLSWSTATETNSDRFEVQRAADGKTWTRIATVQSHGESSTVRGYQYIDTAPQGISYYRLKMIDKDETFAYSRIVSVAAGIGAAHIYPNPASEWVLINPDRFKGAKQVSLISAGGKTIFTRHAELTAPIRLDGLAQGIYLIKITAADGSVTTEKLVVKK